MFASDLIKTPKEIIETENKITFVFEFNKDITKDAIFMQQLRDYLSNHNSKLIVNYNNVQFSSDLFTIDTKKKHLGSYKYDNNTLLVAWIL